MRSRPGHMQPRFLHTLVMPPTGHAVNRPLNRFGARRRTGPQSGLASEKPQSSAPFEASLPGFPYAGRTQSHRDFVDIWPEIRTLFLDPSWPGQVGGDHSPAEPLRSAFGGTIAVGEDEHGHPIRKRIKEHMTALINQALNARQLALPKQDHDVEDQLCTQTYVLTDHGVVYSKGNDHIVDALRCALLRRAQERGDLFDSVEVLGSLSPVTTKPIFE